MSNNKPFIYSHVEQKRIVNGKIVQDSAVNLEYNGKALHVDERQNKKKHHFLVKDKELKKLMKNKTNKMSLLDRLHKWKSRKHKRRKSTLRISSKRQSKR